MEHVFVNGELIRAELAQLSVLDRSILWGERLECAVMLNNSRPLRLNRHIDVLAESLRLPEIGISHALSSRLLERAIATLVSRSGVYNGIARIILTPGCSPVEEEFGILLRQDVNEIILLSDYTYKQSKAEQGVDVTYACFRRLRGDPLALHKFGTSMREHVALRKAVAEGYDEAVICDEDGALLATTRANIFAVVDGGVITPHPKKDGVVPGVMRELVLETLAREGVMLYQERLSSEVVSAAEELFICGSAVGGVIPVRRLGARQYTQRTVTAKLIQALKQRIQKELPAL